MPCKDNHVPSFREEDKINKMNLISLASNNDVVCSLLPLPSSFKDHLHLANWISSEGNTHRSPTKIEDKIRLRIDRITDRSLYRRHVPAAKRLAYATGKRSDISQASEDLHVSNDQAQARRDARC